MAADGVLERSEGELPWPRAWLVAGAATLVMSVSYVDRQVLAALAKTVREALDISREQYGWLQAAFALAYLVAAPIAGVLVDRVGARRGLVMAVLVWSAVAAAHAVVPSFAVLFAMRLALGTAEAPSFPGAAQAVGRVLPVSHRAAGFGVLFTGSSLGAAIAAPLAIAIKSNFGWRPAFVGTAAFGLLWIPLWLLATRHPRVRALLSGAGAPAASVSPAMSRTQLLVSRPVLRGMILVLASAPALTFGFSWMALYLQDGPLHVAEQDVGRTMWLPPLVFDAGAVGFGLIASLRDRRLARAGLGRRSHGDLAAAAALLCACLALVPLAQTPWQAVGLASLSMAGGGALYGRLTADMLGRVDPRYVSMAGGLTAAAQSLVQVAGNPVVGRVVDSTHSYTGVLITLGLLAVPGTLAWIVFPIGEPRAVSGDPVRSSAS